MNPYWHPASHHHYRGAHRKPPWRRTKATIRTLTAPLRPAVGWSYGIAL